MTTTCYPLAGLPARPMMGATLTPRTVVKLVRQIEADGYLVQPKLNGDRVLLWKHEGQVAAFNRHGGRYSFNVHPVEWEALPDDSLLDGEGWRGRFYPFEALQIGGDNLLDSCVTIRTATAKDACRVLGMPWIFDRPTDAWLRNCRDNLPSWEGIVAKQIGAPYEPLKKSNYTSAEWYKLKW